MTADDETQPQSLPAPAQTPAPSGRRVAVVIAVLIASLLAVDFATPTVLNGDADWLQAICLGACAGQLNLIAIWAALAPGNIVLRLPWSMLLAVLMWYAIVLGFRAAGPTELGVALTLGACLLGAVVAVQVPLWIAARWFGWRLTGPQHADRTAASSRLQFELRQMLLGTAIVAAALAPARLILPPGAAELDLEAEMLLVLSVVLAVNLLVVVPCIWLAFGSWAAPGRLVLAWLAYTAVVTVAEIASFIGLTAGPFALEMVEITLLYCALNVTQCATVAGVLLALRHLGYRFERA